MIGLLIGLGGAAVGAYGYKLIKDAMQSPAHDNGPTLGARALEVSFAEMAKGVEEDAPGSHTGPRILEYMLGNVGNFCAGGFCFAERAALLPGEKMAHDYALRVADVIKSAGKLYHPLAEGYTPKPGDGAIFGREDENPENGGRGHITRVITPPNAAGDYESIGCNEGGDMGKTKRAGWRRSWRNVKAKQPIPLIGWLETPAHGPAGTSPTSTRPTKTNASPSPSKTASPAPASPAGKPSSVITSPLPRSGAGLAAGLLLAAIKANEIDPIHWIDIRAGDYIVTVAADAVSSSKTHLRLPISYAEQVQACKLLGCVSPTVEICEAIYRQSPKLAFTGLWSKPEDDKLMGTVEWCQRFNDAIERQLKAIGGLPVDQPITAWKWWVLAPRINEKGAVNFGGYKKGGELAQTEGHRHDPGHYDYSQLFQPVKRMAKTLDGKPVDLLDVFAKLGVPPAYLEVYK